MEWTIAMMTLFLSTRALRIEMVLARRARNDLTVLGDTEAFHE